MSASSGSFCNSVYVEWNDVPGATSYEIYRSTTTTRPLLPIATLWPTSNYTDIATVNGTRYYYWIVAYRLPCLFNNWSEESARVSGYKGQAPAQPINVQATDGTVCGAVRVTWDQPSLLGGNPSDFIIFRNTNNVYLGSTEVGGVHATQREFYDTTAVPGTTYYYWVRAENHCGAGWASSSASGTPNHLSVPANNTCSNASPVTAGNTYLGNTTCATGQISGNFGCGSSGSPDVWYRFTAPAGGTLHGETCGASGSFDTVITIHHDSCTQGLSIGCNRNACPNNLSRVDVPVTGGWSYHVRVSGFNGASGSYALKIDFTPDAQPCYANCDQSTAEPILNVDDFTCFINAFAGAQNLTHAQQIEHYANCDGSTTSPVLNVDDFTCFINAFAAGCP